MESPKDGNSLHCCVMSDFSDKDDRDLVQLVLQWRDQRGNIDWQRVSTGFGARKTKLALRQRLKTLKRTHGRLEAFPQRLLCPMPQNPRIQLEPLKENKNGLYVSLERIFGEFTHADVRQPSGCASWNVGEIAQVGMTRLLDRLQLSSGDTFGDVGSGTGNVLAQVALETAVAKCIGVEIRYTVAKKSRAALKKWSLEFPRLSCISVLSGDIEAPTRLVTQELMKCTVIYSSNKLFSENANLQLQQCICSSTAATIVVLGQQVCSRCRPGCPKEFCQIWKLEERIVVEACWTRLDYLFLYRRRLSHYSAKRNG